MAGLAGAVADGVPDGAAAGVAGWLPQAASVTGTTAIARPSRLRSCVRIHGGLLRRGAAERAALPLAIQRPAA